MGHAILMSADVTREPCAAINTDDFYGAASYKILHDQLNSNSSDYSMVGFAFRNTLSKVLRRQLDVLHAQLARITPLPLPRTEVRKL